MLWGWEGNAGWLILFVDKRVSNIDGSIGDEISLKVKQFQCIVLLRLSSLSYVNRITKSKVSKYSNTDSSSLSRHTATETHMLYGITQCYLPPGRGDIPSFTRAKVVLDLATPEGCKAELT